MTIPLPTLLSQTLVAFTIECDNDFEHRVPHSTTRHTAAGQAQGPWLVSMAMYFNCLRFVGDDGIRAAALEDIARTKTNLNGMIRWRHITIAPDPSDRRAKPPRSQWLIRTTPKGRLARDAWQPLLGEIERRWGDRFGAAKIEKLRESLAALNARLNLDQPDCMPILGYGLFSRGPAHPPRTKPAAAAPQTLPLPSLLSRVLLAFAIEYETESDWSLAIGANILRVLDDTGVRVRNLPLLSGVSKEAIAMALHVLEKGKTVAVEKGPAKMVGLTEKGIRDQAAYRARLATLEKRWQSRFGSELASLTESLVHLAGDGTPQGSPLFAGLNPYPDNWRAQVPKPQTLPHYPMVLHRGGFPDGS